MYAHGVYFGNEMNSPGGRNLDDQIERSINELKERINKIEASQAMRDVTLKNIEQKIDHLTDMSEKNDVKYQNREHCDQLSIFQARELEIMTKRMDTSEQKFETHMKDHYSKADRLATWLTTAMVSAFVIAKMANLI